VAIKALGRENSNHRMFNKTYIIGKFPYIIVTSLMIYLIKVAFTLLKGNP
jgi:hypothetical protein